MYSMVLMAALTTGTGVPDFGRHGCHGCWGGCYGCWGGCHGGWGGCYGCWGGCYGGWGGCYGGYGCGGWGCYGWGGGWGGWGGGYGGLGYVYAPLAPVYAAPTALTYNTAPATAPLTTRSMYPDTSANNRATIIVHLPEAARLTVDGRSTSSTSATRHFYSPPLESGKTYHYTFQARMERDGKTVTAERSVDVSAGDRREVNITLPDLNQSPERQSARPEEKQGTRNQPVRADTR
jgi:uncharacterized protein (TIGR03000 family)